MDTQTETTAPKTLTEHRFEELSLAYDAAGRILREAARDLIRTSMPKRARGARIWCADGPHCHPFIADFFDAKGRTFDDFPFSDRVNVALPVYAGHHEELDIHFERDQNSDGEQWWNVYRSEV